MYEMGVLLKAKIFNLICKNEFKSLVAIIYTRFNQLGAKLFYHKLSKFNFHAAKQYDNRAFIIHVFILVGFTTNIDKKND